MTRAQGEKIAVLQTQVESLTLQFAEHKQDTLALSRKLDMVLENQHAGHLDRAALKNDIAAMKPDVRTIAEAKLVWKYGRWLVGGVGAIAAGMAAFKGWIVVNWEYITTR